MESERYGQLAFHNSQLSTKDQELTVKAWIANLTLISISKTIKFTTEVSGENNAPVTWRSYPDERPVFSGGETISGFAKIGLYNDEYRTHLPAGKGGDDADDTCK